MYVVLSNDHIRVMTGHCLGTTALNEAERPVGNCLDSGIIGIILFEVYLGRRILEGKPGVVPARHEPCSQSPIVHEGNKSALLSLTKQTSHVRESHARSTCSIIIGKQTEQGIQKCADLVASTAG